MDWSKRPPRGRPKGSSRFEVRTTISLTAEMKERIEDKARKDDQTLAAAARSILEKGLEVTEPGTNQVLITLAASDLDSLQKAERNGLVVDVNYAIQEAVRRYLMDWLPAYLEAKEKTLGSV